MTASKLFNIFGHPYTLLTLVSNFIPFCVYLKLS